MRCPADALRGPLGKLVAEAGFEPAIAAYETAALPLGYSAVSGENWHGVPVLPRARRVLETSLRKLTPAVW